MPRTFDAKFLYQVNYLYLDIETIPCQNVEERNEIIANAKPPANFKKPESIEQWRVENADKIIAKTSFDGASGEICTIAWSFGGENVHSHHQRMYSTNPEKELLEAWSGQLEAAAASLPPVIVGHNVNRFDIRFIWQRSIVHGVRLPSWFPKDPKPWGNETFDTMTAWAGSNGTISQDKLANTLDIPGKNGVDGSMIAGMWRDGKHTEISEYCANDVRTVCMIHQKMKRAGM